jgi:TonB-dependent SusC/RagA subfamily outer membrane receptor
MISFSPRAALPIGLLVGLSSGCVHRSSTSPLSLPPSSALTAEDIQRTPGQSIEQLLTGRFPGVEVTRTTGGGISVRIRGTTSFLSNNEPLYVLDGIPMEPGPSGGLSWINPYDIASIEVLKNAAETALYGMRGANGVIIIKTKRPIIKAPPRRPPRSRNVVTTGRAHPLQRIVSQPRAQLAAT